MNNEFYSLVVVLIVSVLVFSYIYGKQGMSMGIRHLLMLGFVMRLVLLFADYYKWFPILNSGVDTEMFHGVSAANVNTYEHYYRGGYTQVLTYFYILTGTSRLLAQFMNILMGMGIILMVWQCMELLKVKDKNQLIVTAILCCMPNLCVFSAILLREAWCEFFVALSLYAFLKWFVQGFSLYIALCVASVLAAAYMHAGTLVLVFGYIVAFITYSPKTQVITFSRTSIISIILLLGLGVALSSYLDLFTSKFQGYESIDDIVEVTNKDNSGGSAYLQWIRTSSVGMSLLFAPLKMIYFMFSPLPTEWRGLKDIIGFLIDGALYMYMFYYIGKGNIQSSLLQKLRKYLILVLIIPIFVFSYGTANAGTAFRHRSKIIAIVALAYSISYTPEKRRIAL